MRDSPLITHPVKLSHSENENENQYLLGDGQNLPIEYWKLLSIEWYLAIKF